MGLMVYGKYRRTGGYQMQQLMRMINANEEYLSNEVTNIKRILANRPKTNWFSHNVKFIVDYIKGKDLGLVDLLLYEQYCTYSILEVYPLLEQSGLQFVAFNDVKMKISYR